MASWYQYLIIRVRSAANEGLKVIDVDGSYLPHKHEQLMEAGVQVSTLCPSPGGWEAVTEDNHRDMAQKIPVVLPGRIQLSLPSPNTHMHIHVHTHLLPQFPPLLSLYNAPSIFCHTLNFDPSMIFFPGVLYSYLAEGVGHSTGKGAF